MQNLILKKFKNAYCDAIGLTLGEFVDIATIENEIDVAAKLSQEECDAICEYAIIKNVLAGVGELYLKVPKLGCGLKYFDKYNLRGKEIISARQIDGLTARDIVGGRLMIEVESLLEYNEDYLSRIVDFSATTQTPVIVKLGQSLEEVGKVVNKFNASPAEVLENFGFLDRECLIYGLNFLDKEDQRLIKNYNPTLILSPRDDAENGRGSVNLYNFIFNGLNFKFASGGGWNVDMIAEGKLAIYNTSNLMYETGLVSTQDVLKALQSDVGEITLNVDEFAKEKVILDQKVTLKNDQLYQTMENLKEKIKNIIKELET